MRRERTRASNAKMSPVNRSKFLSTRATLWFVALLCLFPNLSFANGARVIFYKHSGYRGKSFMVRVHKQRIHRILYKLRGWNDEISSFKIIGKVQVRVWENSKLRGRARDFTRSVPFLSKVRLHSRTRKHWNDRISSLRVIYRGR